MIIRKATKADINGVLELQSLVCIAKTLRGGGSFFELFQTTRSNLTQRYPIGITFINQINPRSLKTHTKLGLQIIDEFEFIDTLRPQGQRFRYESY